MRITLADAKRLGIAGPLPKRGTRAKKRRSEPALLPDGTVLLRCEIKGRAVPWSTPMIGQGKPVKEPRLTSWQQEMSLRARQWRKVSEPYAGPVEVFVVARFAKGPIGDACNILKAVEDSMNRVIYIDDRQVVKTHCERSIAGYDRLTIEVRAASPTPDE